MNITAVRMRQLRRAAVVLVHLGLVVVASYTAIWLRFDGAIPSVDRQTWLRALPWLVVIRAAAFARFRLFEGLWRYVGIWDLRNIVSAVLISSFAHYLLIHWVFGWTDYPRSVFITDSGCLILLMGGVRMARRVLTELRQGDGGKRMLVYGAGGAGEMIVRDMKGQTWLDNHPVGFIDDDAAKVGQRIHGVPILGTRDDLPRVMRRARPDEVLIAIPRADPGTMRDIVRALEPFKIPIKTLPNLRDIIDGRVKVGQIRSLAVEDLLSRAPVGLDQAPLKQLIAGRCVLVTGAGGSIGSELCRQIVKLAPSGLVMLDRYENGLHAIRLELDATPGARVAALVGDVTDANRIDAVLGDHRPEIVFHAAAHKHVPLMEENPCEAIKNNVRGTRILAESADRHGVDRFIMISTDKAVNPANIMGASKRLAELVIQQQAVCSGTSFSIVRFGNVLGSNGSVVPLFLEQIRRGGPVTVTHPEMKRFFMLIPEAVQLVLHAAAQAQGGAIYVLEMGEQVKLVDMARNLIRLSGFVPDHDIAIEFVGLRPGEKLCEELVGEDETAEASAVDKILRVTSTMRPQADLAAGIHAIEESAAAADTTATLAWVGRLLPEFLSERTAPATASEPAQHVPQTTAGVHFIEQYCPSCASNHVHRLHAQSLVERLRRRLVDKRLFKCGDCGWRGWLVPLALELPSASIPAPALPNLDDLPDGAALRQRTVFSPRDLQ